MSIITERLETLFRELDDCRALALADISTRTVLWKSARGRQPQERLDALCRAAQELFCGRTARVAAPVLAGTPPEDAQRTGDASHQAAPSPAGHPQPQRAVLTGTSEQCLLLRTPDTPQEVLIAICDIAADSEQLLARMARTLEALS